MNKHHKCMVGDFVEVRSKEDILDTLDKSGRLAGLPFMPQMFKYCGQRFVVYKRAHKTCDTVNQTGGRAMADAVHLELRCDGKAYGGCQAGCLIFWKDAWLKPVDSTKPPDLSATVLNVEPRSRQRCTEQDVWAATRAPGRQNDREPAYVCQATQLPAATTPLTWWDVRQYVADYASGNVGVARILRGLLYASYYNLSRAGIGLEPIMRWFYDHFQALWGGLPYPRKAGSIPAGGRTPHAALNLQPGELVRVKSLEQILATLDTDNKNRGLYFDAEAVPYCGQTYRVLSRVNKILDEKTGRLVEFKNEAIILEGVFCQARYSTCRMFCPRAIYTYWREIWLERVSESYPGRKKVVPQDGGCLAR